MVSLLLTLHAHCEVSYQTVPASIPFEIAIALLISLVNTAAANPYFVLLARFNTSDTSLNL
uniref:Uncharacterized protein n=1 Tax=Ciona intestinalis TaxID=7719 RepID=H2Y1N5_CIOIN